MLVEPITAESLTGLQAHFRNYPDFDNYPPNQAMIERLNQGERTPADLRFYEHEMIEAGVLGDGNVQANVERERERLRDAHQWTLGRQNIRYVPGYEAELYHREVIERFPDEFSDQARARAIPIEIQGT